MFAGDLLVEDGVTMVVDGNSHVLLTALDSIQRLGPSTLVPGHGAIPRRPAELIAGTTSYFVQLREEMKLAILHGQPMGRALRGLPPADQNRPVSLNSRRRRNAVRVYLEEERSYMGLESTGDSTP